jgi:cytochrome P450
MSTQPLPPGSTGLPLLGETLSFIGDMFGFITSRSDKHGPVFRTKILGLDTAILSGPAATAKFLDETVIQREGAMPPNVQALFGGAPPLGGPILPLLDGRAHHARKSLVMKAFEREAIASYLPKMQATVERTLADWEAREVAVIEPLKRLALEMIASDVMSLEPGPVFERFAEQYGVVIAGLAALPIDLPGTGYRKGLRARDEVLQILRDQVKRHRSEKLDDGLGRMLAARLEDGTALEDEEAVRELHHVHLAGYIVFGELAGILMALDRDPALRDALAAEVKRESKEGPITAGQLRNMHELQRFVMETKRHTPVVPIVFGKAKQDFEVEGVRIPKGWMVLLGLASSNMWKPAFADPHRFDPARFAEGRDEGKDEKTVLVPQGGGEQLGHKCAGKDYSTVLMQVFTVVLLRSYRAELPKQRLELDMKKLPPEPRDGLRVRLQRG